jgi:hypothetical protein
MSRGAHRFDDSQRVEARCSPTLHAGLRERNLVREATISEQWRGIDRVAIVATVGNGTRLRSRQAIEQIAGERGGRR